MKYYYLNLERKNKIIDTYLVTSVKLNPKQMFQIDSFKITLDNKIIDDIFQNLILNSYLYFIKNISEEEELENIVKKEKFIDMLNSNYFCQIPFCLMENSIIKNNDNTSDIIFTFRWNNFFSNPLVLTRGYIIAIKINGFIQKDYIKNLHTYNNYIKFISYDNYYQHDDLSCMNFYQSTSVEDIFFEDFLNKYNKENESTDKFIVRKKCNFISDSRGFVVMIHKFTYDKLESIQIFANGYERCPVLSKNY